MACRGRSNPAKWRSWLGSPTRYSAPRPGPKPPTGACAPFGGVAIRWKSNAHGPPLFSPCPLARFLRHSVPVVILMVVVMMVVVLVVMVVVTVICAPTIDNDNCNVFAPSHPSCPKKTVLSVWVRDQTRLLPRHKQKLQLFEEVMHS